MPEVVNLADRIEKQLPAELKRFMQEAGKMAQGRGMALYLVGGVVRDMLLGRANLDLDLVVEGDAIALAREMADIRQGKVVIHPRFGTARVQWDRWSVDLATTRSETYARPGALPTVHPSSLRNDLFRRDFTVNAMAVDIGPARYGELVDIYGGIADLERRLIRVLHDRSFIDDTTRIWRALRYEQRLDFQIEPDTMELIGHGLPMLEAISGDRIRHELELVLREELPERTLRRAGGLGVLSKLHPSLKAGGWLAEKFALARAQASPDLPSTAVYLSLLMYRLSESELDRVLSYLRFTKAVTRVLRDTADLKDELAILVSVELKPSAIYSLLQDYSVAALNSTMIATESAVIRESIGLFLRKLRHVKPALTGGDLARMGIAPGHRIKEILSRLRQAKLDGEVSSKQDEERLVVGWGGLNTNGLSHICRPLPDFLF
ncbi:CCA tRNA nucleotidyltransferase [Chloroflexota bacterium]